jgi:hypothetical protein
MKYIRIILVMLFSVICYAEDMALKEIESGASRDIEYKILRKQNEDGVIYLKLFSRLNYDARIVISIIPGAGDGIGDVRKRIIIPKNSSWPLTGNGSIQTSFKFPGVRIGEIERGVITEEEGVFYDSDGNENYSRVYKFKLDDEIKK